MEPVSDEDVRKWGGGNLDKALEEWAKEGRKIDGLEKILNRFLEDPPDEIVNPDTKLATWDVARSLRYVGTSYSVPLLIKIIEDKNMDFWTRNFSASALGSIGDLCALGPLIRIVRSNKEDKSLRMHAILGLEELGDPAAIPVIEEFLKSDEIDETDRQHAKLSLEELKKKNLKE